MEIIRPYSPYFYTICKKKKTSNLQTSNSINETIGERENLFNRNNLYQGMNSGRIVLADPSSVSTVAQMTVLSPPSIERVE